MPRDYKLYLEDILEAIAKIQRYTEGLSEEVLCRDSKTLDAVVRNLEVIVQNKLPLLKEPLHKLLEN